MMVGFLTRALALVLGYAYPAYECFKAVELNKPEIEQLRFWCQYWILVAALTVLERVGDNFISWLPMYSEAKLAFFVYLWYPKTKGTTYVYETFFRPYVAKHEMEIDRNLLELRTRAGDMVVLYWQKAATYGQTKVFEILQYVAAQSQAPPSRSRPFQQQRQPSVSPQGAAPPPPPAPVGPTKNLPEEVTKTGSGSSAAAQPQPSLHTTTTTSVPTGGTDGRTTPTVPSGPEAMQVELLANAAGNNDAQETPIEESIRVTRARLRK